MPTFDYQCTDCGKTYDIFHKVREIEDDVICPSCTSKKHQRLLSAPNISVGENSSHDYSSSMPKTNYGGGCCGGGACGLN